MSAAFTLLKDFQTAIVGLIGFAGVITTLYVNAKIARDARKATIDHERQATITMLREELSFVRIIYEGRIKTLTDAKDDAGGVFIHVRLQTPLYESVIGKLGLLSAPQVQAVLNAYQQIGQSQINARHYYTKGSKPDAEFVSVGREHFSTLLRTDKSLMEEIQGALTALVDRI